MAESMTRPSGKDPRAFIAGIEDERKREDAGRLIDMMTAATGEAPAMWGDSIVGFGSYHYKYASGHEGDSFLVGFAPRKAEFSIYLMGAYTTEARPRAEALLANLGKHRMGKACLYVKRLSDIDATALAELIDLSIAGLRATYPAK